jgi:hypothetical protein
MGASHPAKATPSARETKALAAVAAVAVVLAVYAVRSADADLWGHLRYGQHILENGGRVGADPFAYTTTGRVWNDHEYLAQMALWLAYAGAGPVGLIVLKCVLGLATAYLLYRALRLGTDDPRIWAPLLVLLAAGVGRWLLFRPQLFSFLLMALFVLVLFRHLVGHDFDPDSARRGRSPDPHCGPARLWLLPILVPLWVNLHGGFLAGIGAVGLALALRVVQGLYRHGFRAKSVLVSALPLSITLAACLAATLLNPLGWRLWPYLRTELGFSDNRVYIQEWQPLWQVWGLWPALVPFFAVLAVLVVVGVGACRAGTRIAAIPAWVWLLSCVPLTVMAFQSNRHIPVQLIWAAPVVGLLAPVAKPKLWLGVTTLAGAVAVLATMPVLLDPRPRIGLGPSAFGATRPDRAVAFMKVNGLKGNVLTPLWWGSYLTWELYPNVRVSMDGRNVTLFGREQVAANFHVYSDERPDLDTPWAGAPDYLLVPCDTPGLGVIRTDRRWEVLYEDAGAVVFVRTDHRALIELRDDLMAPPSAVAEFFH